MKKSVFYNFIIPLLSILVVLAIWTGVAIAYDSPLILPNALDVAVDFGLLFTSGEFYLSMCMTFLRSLACFASALLLAYPLALASAFSAAFAKIMQPIVNFLRSVPVIAVILITLVAFSSSFIPVFVGFLTVFPLLYSAYYAALTTDEMKVRLSMADLYKVKSSQKARYLFVPAMTPVSFEQAETLLPLSVKVVISGEVLAFTKNGIGLLMHSAQLNVEISKLFAYAFSAVLLSYLAKLLVKLIHLCCRRLKLCR